MEKSTQNKRFFCLGLLIILSSLLCLAAAEPVLEEPKTSCFENDVLTFVIVIKDCLPKGVTFTVPKPEDNVTRLSANKIQTYEHGTVNTKIELVYAFKKAGNYNLPEVQITINSTAHTVKMPRILVYHNPALHKPELKWELSAPKAVTGGTYELRLTARYVKKIHSLQFEQPEDALFEQTSELTDTFDYKPSVKEPAKIVAAKYSWTPLQSGTIELPVIKLELTGTNGADQTFILKGQTVKVYEQTDSQNDETGFSTFNFEAAFNEETQQTAAIPQTVVSQNLAQQLAELRKSEKYSLNFIKSRKERQELENKNNISAKSEFPLLLLILPSVMFIICLLIYIFLKKSKKTAGANVFFVISLILFVLTAKCAFETITQKAVFAGGQIFTIPDETGTVLEQINAGNLFIVKKQTEEWCLVKYGENHTGWVKTNTLCFIEKAD